MFYYLFDSALGAWHTKPVDLELIDDVEPVLLFLYSVPIVNEAMFRKEVDRLVSLGFLECVISFFTRTKVNKIGYNFRAISNT